MTGGIDMKKIFIIGLCTLFVTALSGCSVFTVKTDEDFVSRTEVVIEKEHDATENEDWEVILTAESITADGLTLKAETTDPTAQITTGSEFWLDIYTDDGWQEAQRITDEDIFWDALGYLFEDGKAEWEIGWSHIYGTLESGKYRIGKKFSSEDGNKKYCYAQFEIE